jgi:RimJ/RimL family protein N-acetyltransferase
MSLPDITIRPITFADIPGFHAALDSVAQEGIYISTQRAAALPSVASFIVGNITSANVQLVADSAGQIVGWCDVCHSGSMVFDHVGTLGMGVIASHRGRGVGTRLIAATIAAAWQSDFQRIELEVYASNTNARALYERHEFVLEGTKRFGASVRGSYTDVHQMALFRPGWQP